MVLISWTASVPGLKLCTTPVTVIVIKGRGSSLILFYDTHLVGSTRKNLDVFQKLCGKDRVVLCTTKWSDIQQEEGERQTERLKKITGRR